MMDEMIAFCQAFRTALLAAALRTLYPHTMLCRHEDVHVATFYAIFPACPSFLFLILFFRAWLTSPSQKT